MERKYLVNEIADFCIDYKLFKTKLGTNEVKRKIEEQLEDSEFIESLINTVILKTKKCKNVEIERLKILLLELEKIRLELEYKDYNK